MPSLQQYLNKIPDVFYACGGDTAVVCPGSRNAPILVAFARHPCLKIIPVADERSAAFIGLGIASATKKPVALICTSGTAALNFYPAIAEAYYQNVPLVVITADRPPELINQWDGQAIMQHRVFHPHILDEWDFPGATPGYSLTQMAVSLQQIIQTCLLQQMPVHLNVPLHEPFYPAPDEQYNFDESRKPLPSPILLPQHQSPLDLHDPLVVIEEIQWIRRKNPMTRVLIVLGYNHDNVQEIELLHQTANTLNIPVLVDVISSPNKERGILHYDYIVDAIEQPTRFQPDILITTGSMVLSKSLRKFLRNHKPAHHYHIQEIGHVGDPFQSLTAIVRGTSIPFWNVLSRESAFEPGYLKLWQQTSQRLHPEAIIDALPYCELKASQLIISKVPENSTLHLANSMPVRYALIAGLPIGVHPYANRGTSGIDGCTSTAVGAASVQKGFTTLITGDMAFFYDSNAFWNKLRLPNLRIIVLNNGGGGIFRLIEGPSGLPELETLLEQAHTRSAVHLAHDFGIEYLSVSNEENLKLALENFYTASDSPKLLELFTDKQVNTEAYKWFKGEVRKQLNQA